MLYVLCRMWTEIYWFMKEKTRLKRIIDSKNKKSRMFFFIFFFICVRKNEVAQNLLFLSYIRKFYISNSFLNTFKYCPLLLYTDNLKRMPELPWRPVFQVINYICHSGASRSHSIPASIISPLFTFASVPIISHRRRLGDSGGKWKERKSVILSGLWMIQDIHGYETICCIMSRFLTLAAYC